MAPVPVQMDGWGRSVPHLVQKADSVPTAPIFAAVKKMDVAMLLMGRAHVIVAGKACIVDSSALKGSLDRIVQRNVHVSMAVHVTRWMDHAYAMLDGEGPTALKGVQMAHSVTVVPKYVHVTSTVLVIQKLDACVTQVG